MIILGSTGSIGQSSLKIAKRFRKNVEALVAGKNIDLLNQQIAQFRPKRVCIADKSDYATLQPLGAKVYCGEEGIIELIIDSQSELVINAWVGFMGLLPSITTQKCGKKLALANKESLVSGGWLLDTSAIIPIDSEHFGLWYLRNDRAIKKLIITASGGAFRDFPLESIFSQTKQTALAHPNWKMGKKITIDSATMMNKIFEVLEAFWLFDFTHIEAFIERTSSIHALIEFLDGSTIAHFATPDMCLPIAYAIDPKKAMHSQIVDSLCLEKIQSLRFEFIDSARYPLWELKSYILQNPKSGVIINAANEVAIQRFLKDEIVFGHIKDIVCASLEHFKESLELSALQAYSEILDLDLKVRAWASCFDVFGAKSH